MQIAIPHAHPALARLADRQLLRRAWLDASAAAAGKVLDVRDPATGLRVALVPAQTAADAKDAVHASEAARPGWQKLLPQERAARLKAWHANILAAREDLALIMTLEQGKPLDEARGEIDYAASFVEWYAEETRRLNAEGVTSHLAGAEMQVRREPLGVVAIVTPWNFPSAMLTRKAAAALAAGCTVVAHPSHYTPLSALALQELAARAGIGAAVFDVIVGDAPSIVGAFCAHPEVRALSFTGSTEIGRTIARQCAPTMKRLVMELGGHAPFIVFGDADVDKAADSAVAAKFATSGQDCLAANRIYVERSIYDRFCAAFAERVTALRMGSGLEPASQIGPLMHRRAVEKCAAHVADALARGARLIAGSGEAEVGSLFFAPTALADVPGDALIMREETFGPVASLAPFDSEAEVIARANDTEYGLVAYVFSSDARRCARLGRALQYGMVAVNRVKITGAPIPFGGMKQSGLGREGSRHGIEAFTELKYLCFETTE
jgi:aspartate-semialdehyde dehydrogenase